MEPRHEDRLEEARKYRHTALTLAFGNLEEVPDAIRELPWLESLNVSGNSISHLPDWLTELKSLREVIAFGNALEYAPSGLPIAANWSSIEKIGALDGSVRGVALEWELEALPKRFLSLSSLRDLDLGRWTKDVEPPSWIEPLLAELADRFPRLEWLNLFCCGLKDLPASFGRLARLHVLELTGNPLTRIPAPIKRLKALQHLEANDIGLQSVPDWLFALPDLRLVDLSFNSIHALPPNISVGRPFGVS